MAGEGVITTEGVVTTFTVTVFVEVQPPPLSPVTVYVSVMEGETEVVAVIALPAFALQVNVTAPEAVSVELPLLQIVAGDAVAETVGVAITFTESVYVPAHPPLSPLTVYVVVTVGEAVAVAVVTLPAFALQVYEVAPDAVKVIAVPLHIVVADATAVTVGVEVTVTVIVCALVQVPFAPVTV